MQGGAEHGSMERAHAPRHRLGFIVGGDWGLSVKVLMQSMNVYMLCNRVNGMCLALNKQWICRSYSLFFLHLI